MADKGKDAKKKKDKKGGGGDASDILRVSGHPRAARSVRSIKGWAGLVGFALTFFMSYRSGVPFYWSTLRAVLGGLVAFIVAWACAVTIWRHVLIAEVQAARAAAMARLSSGTERSA